MGYAYDESPFAPLRTTTSGTTNPDKDAEIARLRAQAALFDAQREAVVRELVGLGVEYGTPDDYARAAAGFIARLRAELDAAKAERDSARAALDKEREACDEYRESHRPECCDETLGGRGPHATDRRCRKCREYDARRAAEAQEPPHA